MEKEEKERKGLKMMFNEQSLRQFNEILYLCDESVRKNSFQTEEKNNVRLSIVNGGKTFKSQSLQLLTRENKAFFEEKYSIFLLLLVMLAANFTIKYYIN